MYKCFEVGMMALAKQAGWQEYAYNAGLIALSCLLIICVVIAEGESRLVTAELIAKAKQTFGDSIQETLEGWGQSLLESQQESELDKLSQINNYFNRRIAFKSDLSHWKKEDYWATPLETLASSGGDCEDYVIAKYFSLIHAGVDQKKLRITYVKALRLNQAHMVLAYYPKPKADPLILDNLIGQIKHASRRRDLSPVYSFNGYGMWLERMKGGSIKVGDPNRLNMWTDLLLRMEEQGLQVLLANPNQ